MKANAPILKLQKIVAKHGNLEIMCWPYDGQENCSKLTEIKITTNKKDNKSIVVLDA